ncbi:hypothetical protein F2Q69_00047368 [Brassica cretica]|uniref:Uncharacterized protein n=1 Tax=Brassica cretica TaxID=69181 RepID=A0A8S9PR65_BRACR|nr:hypothetical protein F2Q69_00047368 [Brassica cretica]
MDHRTKHAVQLNFELDFQSHRYEVNQHPAAYVMPILLKGGPSTPSSSADGRDGSTKTTSSAIRRAELDGRAGSTTGPAQPSAELDQSSSAVGRAGSNTPPARPSAELDQSTRPSAELDQSSSADCRAGSNTRPARPSAELDLSSSADGRAGPNTRPAQPFAELDQSSLADGRAGTIVLSSSRPRSSPLRN